MTPTEKPSSRGRGRRRVLVLASATAIVAPGLATVGSAQAAPAGTANQAPTVRIVEPEPVFGVRAPIESGGTFIAQASDPDGRVVRVEWFFTSSVFDGPVDYEEPLGISRSAPFTLAFDQPARLFRGGSLVARAYDDKGKTTDTSLAVAVEGAQGFVPLDVRWALPYISEAEQGSSRRSATGTRLLPELAFIGADPVPGASRRPIRGYSGIGAVEFLAPGAFVQWAAKTREGGASDDPIPAGTYVLTWRYNNASTSERSLRLTTASAGVLQGQPRAVNQGLVTFAPTRSAVGQVGWETVSATVTLPAGINNIRLTSTTGTGPLLDYLTVTPAP